MNDYVQAYLNVLSPFLHAPNSLTSNMDIY